ncbi:uncharacterized protein LOC125528144 [Triticum urartu]|uniref:DUF1618 domain-containing protein n=1 Tax=Triticum urartu TaxID=4572 RepID=A0A8R7VAU1_TRIUA|nr:uncharacterized protein LOC125528144 [Triticum urartu]
MAPTEGSSMADLPAVDDDQEEETPIPRPVSWLPPHTPHDCGDPPPKSVVLDTLVYADDRTNAFTAEGFTSNGLAIYLTFWPAHPPLISYFTVHLPGLLQDGPATSLDLLPRLLRTDGDLALFRIMVGPSRSNRKHINYMIYRVRAGISKLEVLPAHPTRLFADCSLALLRCRCPDDGRFLVANLRSIYSRGQYALDLFDSRSGTWSTKSMHAESPEDCYFRTPTKVIALGGDRGSIGWVDLWNGILICDLLADDDQVLRFIRLPVLSAPDKMIPGPLACDRDVSVGSDGCIKYSEVWANPLPGSQNRATYISQDWGAAILTWLEPQKKWQIDLSLKASDIIVDKSHPQLLPHHVKATTKKPTLSRLHAGHPALSLHDDGVVYIMTKVDHREDDLWMLAVDMRSKTLKGVAGLTSKRTMGFRFMYLQSDLSNHLVATSKKTEVSNHLVATSKTETSKNLPKSKRSSRRKKRGKKEAVKALANSNGVDVDATRRESQQLVQLAEQEEQELRILEVF